MLRKGQALNNMAEIFIDQGRSPRRSRLLEALRESWEHIPYPFGVGVAT